MNFPSKTGRSHDIGLIKNPLVLFMLLAVMAMPVLAGTVAPAPLFLTTAVKPNIMLMVDDSGSMSSVVPNTGTGTTYNSATTYLSGQCVYSSYSRNNHAMSNSATYDTSVPSGFLGNGRGNKCFASNLNYSFDSTMTALMTAAGATSNAAKANYANWYYTNQLSLANSAQTRLEIVKSAASALIDSLDSNVRMGISTLAYQDGGILLEAVDDLTDTKKTNIKNRLNSLSASTWTPLAGTQSGIGRYFATGYTGNLTLHPGKSNQATQSVSNIFPNALNDSTIWRTRAAGEPTFSTPPIQYSCQKSFSVLMTDGLPTQDRSISSYLQDYDGDCSTNPSLCLSQTPNYDIKKAFPSTADNTSDYLDDVSQALFEMDLRPDLVDANGAKNNLITYAVGIADDSINPNLPGVNPLLKEAAEQSGGQFYFAGNATEMAQSLISAFSFIIQQSASSSSVATNSTQFQTNSILYQAKFDSYQWTGQLLAFQLLTEDTNGNGILDAGEDTNHNGILDVGIIGPRLWDAGTLIPAATNRHIYAYNPTATTTKGIELLWANLNATQKSVLDNANASASSSPILDYLRGDQSKEQANGGAYRNRGAVLGDIVNSNPLFVSTQDLGYGSLAGTEGTSYTAFRASNAYQTRRAMLYVGANDGMLHGFDAGTGADGGKEIFAYLPNAVISPDLVNLTSPNYSHQYFVDGSPQFGDAYFSSAWHTVLVGSMGAGNTTTTSGTTGPATGSGGRGLFALDVTNPDDFATPATGASRVLWEFTSRNDADLGYTIPQPGIVRMMSTGQWAAIVANGYDSASGKAALFILDIQTGSVIKKIVAESASGVNGLSSPVAVDVDNDKIVDYIYAGDLNGHLWKFDVSSSDSTNWGVAYGGSPVFTATDGATSTPQPITAKLAIGAAKATGQSSGLMIYFGTGKYFETGDNSVPSSPQVQSFYAIWDVCDKTTAANCNGAISGRSQLQAQAILSESSALRITSQCEVAYSTTPPSTSVSPCTNNINRRGWFIDLIPPGAAAQAERVVSVPVLRNSRVIFPTLIPDTTPCSPGGTSWLMELDQNNGARLTATPFDINNDNKVDNNDMVLLNNTSVAASGMKSTVGIIQTPAIINCADGLDCKYASGSSGNLMTVRESAPTSGPGGGGVLGKRISWRQLR